MGEAIPHLSRMESLPEAVQIFFLSYLRSKDLLTLSATCRPLFQFAIANIKEARVRSPVDDGIVASGKRYEGKEVGSLLGPLLFRLPALRRLSMVEIKTPGLSLVPLSGKPVMPLLHTLELEYVDLAGMVALSHHFFASCASPQLRELHLRRCDVSGAVMEAMRNAWHARMQHGCRGLHTLRIESRSEPQFRETVGVNLESMLVTSGACDQLEVLDLSDLCGQGAAALAAKLVGQHEQQQQQQHLRVLRASASSVRVVHLYHALQFATNLETLVLTGSAWGSDEALPVLLQLLGARTWPRLTSLGLCYVSLFGPRMAAFVLALHLGCPQLTALDLGTHTSPHPLNIQPLSVALHQGALPKLEVLEIRGSGFADAELLLLMGAMKEGAPCRATLRRVNLSGSYVSKEGVKQLAEALVGGLWPNLQHLDLSGMVNLNNEAMDSLSVALQAGACPMLESLFLHNTQVCPTGVDMFLRALGSGACPRLRTLRFHYKISSWLQEKLNDMRGEGAVEVL